MGRAHHSGLLIPDLVRLHVLWYTEGNQCKNMKYMSGLSRVVVIIQCQMKWNRCTVYDGSKLYFRPLIKQYICRFSLVGADVNLAAEMEDGAERTYYNILRISWHDPTIVTIQPSTPGRNESSIC